MNIALVTPITLETTTIDQEAWFTELGQRIYEPALGILTLASVLRNEGIAPLVFDLNGFVRELYRTASPPDIVKSAAPLIAQLDTDCFGFGTICGSYPLTIRIAEELKTLRPEARIIFGGPQASVVDVATLEAFPFVDYIIRGEADETIVLALQQIASGSPTTVPGVTHRCRGQIVRNPNAAPVLGLDRVPPPAFELSRSIDRCVYLPIEAGRGCPFSCTFCSTNDFFRRRFRLRSPARVVEEMDRLHAIYGVTLFDLVHDMFTVDRVQVEAFCHAFIASGREYSWRCSARSDCVDRELVELMADAGCRGVFFGVETGSSRLQTIIDKGLDLDEAAAMIECVSRQRLNCTVSLILGFPEETVEDVAATAAFALNSARFDEATVAMNLLAALPATPLFDKYSGQLFFDGIYSDMSHQSWEQNESDCALIQKHTVLFSNFYGLPSGAGRSYVAEFRHFITYGLNRCRWLMIALGDAYPGLINIFDSWIKWRGDDRCRTRYYGKVQFAKDICRFLRETFSLDEMGYPASMFLSYYEVLYEIATGQQEPAAIDVVTDLPSRRQSVRLVKFPFRLSSLIEAVRSKQELTMSWFQETTIAFIRVTQHQIDPCELPDLGAALLQLCDGHSTILEIAHVLGPRCPNLNGFSVQQIILHGLLRLREQGLVCFQDTDVGTSL